MTEAPHPSASEAADLDIVQNELAVQKDAYLRLAAKDVLKLVSTDVQRGFIDFVRD